MSRRAVVAGGGMAGVRAALELADRGVDVCLIEESAELDAHFAEGAGIPERLHLTPTLLRAANHPNIKVMTSTTVAQVSGEKGAFKLSTVQRPKYVSPEECASCGRCEQECPVNIISPNNGNGHKAIHRSGWSLKSVPSACSIDKAGLAPCTAACPAGINAQGYVALISKGKFGEALDLITESVPFPRVLGRVCNHPCEEKCTRGRIDQAVSICALKRFVANGGSGESYLSHDLENGGARGPARVAIIGSGPAGLTAARDLARLGHRSTVFEALPVPGGMISVGMPRFRLPREVRQADINDIVKLGIEIRTSTPIGPDLTLDDLKRQGYKAILLATGAHKNRRLGIPGETLSGVIDSVVFLQALNLKHPVSVGRRVVVIGGGYTGIDSGRTAVRLNCSRVLILERRSRNEMTTNPEEVAEAQEEGVEMQFLVNPLRILGEGSRVIGVECVRMRQEKGGPVPVEGSEFVVEADTVIVAVGQRPDLSFLRDDTALTGGKRYVVIDPRTMATKVPGIFAAGDVAGRPSTMIEAVAAGRRAALSIDRYLHSEDMSLPQARRTPAEVNIEEVYVPPIGRHPMPRLEHKARLGNFEEVDLGFDQDMAVEEARRCLNCGGCSECLECVRACEVNAIDHAAKMRRLEIDADVILAGDDVHSISSRSGVHSFSSASEISRTVANALAELGIADAPVRAISNLTTLRSRPARSVAGSRTGVFVCGCGSNISGVIDIPGVIAHFRSLDGVAHSTMVGYACTEEGAAQIKAAVKDNNLTDVVLAACSCCNFDQICFSCTDRRVRCRTKLLDQDPEVACEFVNIREQCAWVHKEEPEKATAKARSLIAAALARRSGSDPVPAVDPARCRGCGTCVAACPFGSIAYAETPAALRVAQVNKELCRGCGLCVAACPAGAISQPLHSDESVISSLQAILS